MGAARSAPTWANAAEEATSEQLAVLERVLARPEFLAGEGRSVLDVVFDPVRSAVRAALREVARAVARLLEASGDAPSLVGAVLVLAIVLGAGLVVVRLARGTLAAEAELAVAAPSGPPRAEAELARAAALAQAGDFRGAVHHRYLATLRRLDERGLLSFDRSLTNREYLSRIGGSSTLGASLAPLVSAFDGLWYGQSSCSREEYARFASLADRVWEVARSQEPGARR